MFAFYIFANLTIKSKYMGLSSNVLWHQTDKDGLKGILSEKGFFYSYSLENISCKDTIFKAAFPMVSVCDFPLSEFGEYIQRYGNYSIGLSREWGIKKGFTPVWYCEENSPALKIQMEHFYKIQNQLNDVIAEKTEYERFIYLLSYIKNYERELPKRQYTIYRFYDEREFRTVPTPQILEWNGIEVFLNEEEYKRYKMRTGNSLIKSMKVPFEWEDIRFIIVENEDNINEFRRIIERGSEKKNLRINYFTNTQIENDVIGGNHNVKLQIKKIDFDKLNYKSQEKINGPKIQL